jgi:molybdate transport system substrate-binding protein
LSLETLEDLTRSMDLEIMSAGAAKGLVESLEGTFTAETGIGIHGTFNAVGAIHERALAGDACDVIILTAAMIADLARSGCVFPETVASLGRVRTAIAVRERDPLPDVSSREALRTLLLASDEIYVPDVERSTAGIHFVKVLRALGIYEVLAPRLRSFPSGAVAMRALAQSTLAAAVGCTQVTEIKYTKGVALAGALPAEFELATPYSAGVAANARQPAPARRLVGLLSGDAARGLRLAGGFED